MESFGRETESTNVKLSQSIHDALKVYLNKRNKNFVKRQETDEYGFDFFLPEGLDTLVPVFIDIISSLSAVQISHFKSKIDNLLKFDSHLQRVILIISSNCSKLDKRYYETNFIPTNSLIVEIWDIKDVHNFFGSNFNNDTMVDNTPLRILIQPTIDEQANQLLATNLNNAFISQLKHEYEKEKVVLVLGAGVSISAGLPSWYQMISVLQAKMISHYVSKQLGLPSAKAEQIKELASDNFRNIIDGISPLAQMRFIRSALSCEDYNSMVRETLYSNATKDSKLLKAICKICKPTRNNAGVYSIITYNFDDLLEDALKYENIEFKDICSDEDVLSVDDLNVFHVHGFLSRDEKILKQELDLVFSEEEYHHVYNNPYSWSNLTQINSFRDKTCVFIGSSLTDPNLRRLLDISSRKGETPRHFAFLKRPTITNTSLSMSEAVLSTYQDILERLNNLYYRTLGLNIIWVNDLNEIPDLLLMLK